MNRWYGFEPGVGYRVMTAPPERPTNAEREQVAFRRWMRLVEAALVERCGLTSADLPDFPYRDAFDCGEEPGEAADEALEEAGFFLHSDGPDASDGADSDY